MKYIVRNKEILNRPGVELLKGSIEVEMENGPNGMRLTVLKKHPKDLQLEPNDILKLSN